ncbi:MAG: glyoxalase [Gammaproteobacteria bacterium]|nr:MAG: glyoxalase [Gammaproteobacteria bacterium]
MVTSSNITGIHHVSLIVSDTDRSVLFYTDILGLTQTARPVLPFPGAWLQAGSQQIHLLEVENPDPVSGRSAHGGRDRHLALAVRSLDAIRKKLDDEDIPYTLSKSGRKALFCRDPDGNAVEIIG